MLALTASLQRLNIMALTNSQLQTLKTFILNTPELAALPNTNDSAYAIIEYMNKLVSPDFIVWKTFVSLADVGKTVNYIAVEAMTDANRGRINTFYYMNPNGFNPSKEDIRAYWSNTFSGTLGGQGQATRDALEALWKRKATVAEKLFATGTGTTLSPATLSFEGFITFNDVTNARSL